MSLFDAFTLDAILYYHSGKFVYVIGWSTVVFGINSTSNAVRKCKIARGDICCDICDIRGSVLYLLSG